MILRHQRVRRNIERRRKTKNFAERDNGKERTIRKNGSIAHIVSHYFSFVFCFFFFFCAHTTHFAEDGMILYCKVGQDGTSVGDCPFAHYVRMVLEEKQLPYILKPTLSDKKPQWLVDYYDGKMPALRHSKECYVESSVIASYLDYFFINESKGQVSLTPTNVELESQAEAALEGFFPAIARYLKDTTTPKDKEELETLQHLRTKLQAVEDHLRSSSKDDQQQEEPIFLVGPQFTLLDCRIVPQLYHLDVGIGGFHSGKPNLEQDYPTLYQYYSQCKERPSFQTTTYPPSTVLWGWGNARK